MEIRRLFDIPLYQLMYLPRKVAISVPASMGQRKYSSQECLHQIMQVSAGALEKGLKRGDRVAILSWQSSPFWTFLDIGLQQVGIIPVPISPQHDDDTLAYILKDAGVRMAFVDDREGHQRLRDIANPQSITDIYTLRDVPDLNGWSDFVTNPSPKHLEQYETSKAVTHEDDLATIVYTAGTSGRPKGVMLSHKNIISNVRAVQQALPIKASHTVVSVLPPHHILERMAMYLYLSVGAQICHLTPSATLLDDIKAARPHFLVAVPALLFSFYEKWVQRILERPANSRSRSLWALKIGRQYRNYGRLPLGYFLKLRMADIMVFQRWRGAFGGRIEGILVGMDALPQAMARLYSAAGIEVLQCYGMAEASPIISMNRLGSGANFGTAGKILDDIQVEITAAQDEFGNGRIRVKGNNLSPGYWQNQEATQAAFHEGWFDTQDVGRLTEQRGFLQISGRQGDLVTLANGETFHPAFVEAKLLDSPYIRHCLVVGQGQKQAAAFIVPYRIHLQLYALQKGIPWDGQESLSQHPDILELMQKEVQATNAQLQPRERIGHFRLAENLGNTRNRKMWLEQHPEWLEELYG